MHVTALLAASFDNKMEKETGSIQPGAYAANVDLSFVLGLLLSIPLSILANVFTPKFQAWMAKRSRSAAEKRERESEEFWKEIDFYKKHLAAYVARSHMMTVRVISYTAAAILFSIPAAHWAMQNDDVSSVKLAVAAALTISAILLALMEVRRARILAFSVIHSAQHDAGYFDEENRAEKGGAAE
ncbi:hypothetical protein FH608_024040 [Nonomuraea phyllanthi]|uniref:Uncharacterized protein n=1 Tax=Nonomuraea phyllanthi TaxID=2219224 RepID=A0A5C4W929_9ACTN|nr:hypothetical protein [Nonomuraea phyllanthi]KAB8192576.1 hypothetical protein FH608_024040 [Nonomuraea phyllanthi]QFY08053.1 hypothetical protein GBF35_16425 [Nonomuraea phyllanthi]